VFRSCVLQSVEEFEILIRHGLEIVNRPALDILAAATAALQNGWRQIHDAPEVMPSQAANQFSE